MIQTSSNTNHRTATTEGQNIRDELINETEQLLSQIDNGYDVFYKE